MATTTKTAAPAAKKAAAAKVAPEPTPETLLIPRLAKETIEVTIKGVTPLIVHRFSEKAKRIMLEAMQGRKSPKEPKNPMEEFEAAAYRFADGGYGFPSIGVKAAMVSAARFYKNVTMVALRQALFVNGEMGMDEQLLIRIIGGTPELLEGPKLREDVVRVGMSGTDLRYRPQWSEWSADVQITYFTGMLDRSAVLALLDAAGTGVGIGEWRPERSGDNGTFTVDESKDIRVLANPTRS